MVVVVVIVPVGMNVMTVGVKHCTHVDSSVP
jgi:hypothetical protein